MQDTQKIIVQIYKNVLSKKRKCMIKECTNHSINSHFLQRNGILNLLANKGHLIEVKIKNPFYFKKNDTPVNFKKVGVNNALSIQLFCNHHDSSIFHTIENTESDLTTYKSFLLLSYRVVCAEIRKKEINIDQFTQIVQSKTLESTIDCEAILLFLHGTMLGIRDLRILQQIFEEEIQTESNRFTYRLFHYPRIDVYASAIFNPNEDEIENYENEIQLENIFIHVIPRQNETLILVGYQRDLQHPWLDSFVNSWENLSPIKLQEQLSELFACRIENWGMSLPLYNNLNSSNIQRFIEHSKENIENLSINKSIQFNLFK